MIRPLARSNITIFNPCIQTEFIFTSPVIYCHHILYVHNKLKKYIHMYTATAAAGPIF